MVRHPFDLLMELHAHDIRLDYAALHLARDRYPTVNVAQYVKRIDALADEVGDLRPGLAANLRFDAMREVLVNRHDFTGNRSHYFDAENCYLNRVLDTGRGIPITLSLLWVEVARRLNWPVFGVALPGHFIVRFDDSERYLLADPFGDGQALSIADCKRMVRQHFGNEMRFSRSYLKPIGNRGILARLLRNLRNIYLARNDLPRVTTVLHRMTAVEPENSRHLQDLAAVCCRRGDVRRACAHLELYLRKAPNAHDSARVRSSIRQLHAALVALN